MGFCGYLKQSTAVDILIGPFVDEDDGKTAETGLTLDVEVSKNGQALANKNDATPPVHDAAGTVDGYYNCELDATDTNTLGILSVVVHTAGALPVHQTYQIVTANWWDTMCSTDQLDVNVTNVAGTSQTANDNGADINAILVDTAEIGAAGAGLTAVVWNSDWDAEVQSEAADALTAYDPPTKAEMDTAHGLLATEAKQDTIDGIVDAILVDTGTTLPTAAAIADAVWDEALADHDTEDTVGNVLNDLVEESGTYRFTTAALAQAPDNTGAGATTFTYTLTSSADGSAIVNADVWVTSDLAGTTVLASGITDANGQVTFYLDAGTVYVWRAKSGWNFTNPDTETVA